MFAKKIIGLLFKKYVYFLNVVFKAMLIQNSLFPAKSCFCGHFWQTLHQVLRAHVIPHFRSLKTKVLKRGSIRFRISRSQERERENREEEQEFSANLVKLSLGVNT